MIVGTDREAGAVGATKYETAFDGLLTSGDLLIDPGSLEAHIAGLAFDD